MNRKDLPLIDALVMTAVLALPNNDRQAAADRATRSAATAPTRWQAFARCVAERESGNNPKARNTSGSSAAGIYQFLDRSWRRPLAFMVAERLKSFGYPKPRAKALRIELQGKNIATWPARWQHVGFAAVISHPGGARHWYLAGSKCNALGGMS